MCARTPNVNNINSGGSRGEARGPPSVPTNLIVVHTERRQNQKKPKKTKKTETKIIMPAKCRRWRACVSAGRLLRAGVTGRPPSQESKTA